MSLTIQTLSRILMTAAHVWCHQIPERSPHLFGWQFPLCWRCTGIALGALLLLAVLVARRRTFPLALSIAVALLMPLDVLINSFGYDEAANARRLVTGALWGVFAVNAALVLLRVAHEKFTARKQKRQIAGAHKTRNASRLIRSTLTRKPGDHRFSRVTRVLRLDDAASAGSIFFARRKVVNSRS